jgi:hypothetical protein
MPWLTCETTERESETTSLSMRTLISTKLCERMRRSCVLEWVSYLPREADELLRTYGCPLPAGTSSGSCLDDVSPTGPLCVA